MVLPTLLPVRSLSVLVLVIPALLCVSGHARDLRQNPPAPATGSRTAGELLSSGETFYNAGNWTEAAAAFQEFLDNFGGLDGTASAVARVKPLLAICHVRLDNLDAALPLLEESLARTDLPAALRTDLLFFSGLAHLREGKADTARRHLGEIFNNLQVERDRRMEALVLAGMTYIIEENWSEAASFFRRYGEEIRTYSPEAGSRARILHLHALMRQEQWRDAAALAAEIHRDLAQTRQVVTFCSQLIELGSHFLEEGELHLAISLLQKVPSKTRIEHLQKDQLAQAEAELTLSASHPVRASQLQTGIAEMRRELEAFEKIPQFDSAARLRVASAWFQLGRIRHACLILDQMVRQMEPDPIVESATASLIRGWMSLERHARAVRSAELYQERCASLPETPNLPDVLFLKAQALEGQFQHREAADAFREIVNDFSGQPIAAQAEFMAAYNVLQLEEYTEAGALFARQEKSLPKTDPMWPHVAFWHAMAFYFDQQWEPCRQQLGRYLTAVKEDSVDAEYVDDAEFRIGYTWFSEARYPEAIAALTRFAADHPQSEWLAEALLTLGDSQAAEGDLDDADRTYSRIGPEAPGFHDEGWMKRGNLHKVRKDLPGMKALFTAFLQQRPDSPRIAEALQWLGWIARQQGDPDEARRIYWDAIARFGNDLPRPGVEEIFLALQSFYPPSERLLLDTRFSDALEKARDRKQHRLATRLGWALAHLRLLKNSPGDHQPEAHLQNYLHSLAALTPDIDPKETAPRLLADVGEALAQLQDNDRATGIYEGLRKWWPRAPERDRAYAGLGFIHQAAGDETDALAAFDRFEKSSVMPRSAPDERGVSLVESELGGKVALARSTLLANRDPDTALHLLLALQKSRAMPARIRAEAHLAAARLHLSLQRNREALPYLEQVYLLFNRFPDLVATAYFERGRTLEKLNLPDKAREVYSELALRDDLKHLEPAKLGLARANALGGVLQPKDPEGALIPPAANPR